MDDAPYDTLGTTTNGATAINIEVVNMNNSCE